MLPRRPCAQAMRSIVRLLCFSPFLPVQALIHSLSTPAALTLHSGRTQQRGIIRSPPLARSPWPQRKKNPAEEKQSKHCYLAPHRNNLGRNELKLHANESPFRHFPARCGRSPRSWHAKKLTSTHTPGGAAGTPKRSGVPSQLRASPRHGMMQERGSRAEAVVTARAGPHTQTKRAHRGRTRTDAAPTSTTAP